MKENLQYVLFILKEVLRVIFFKSSRIDGRLEEMLFASLEFTCTTTNFMLVCSPSHKKEENLQQNISK